MVHGGQLPLKNAKCKKKVQFCKGTERVKTHSKANTVLSYLKPHCLVIWGLNAFFCGTLDYSSIRDNCSLADYDDSVCTVEQAMVTVFISLSAYIDAAVVTDMGILVDDGAFNLAALTDTHVRNLLLLVCSLFFICFVEVGTHHYNTLKVTVFADD